MKQFCSRYSTTDVGARARVCVCVRAFGTMIDWESVCAHASVYFTWEESYVHLMENKRLHDTNVTSIRLTETISNF